jgi:NADPH-dependent curcumin reductase CurA
MPIETREVVLAARPAGWPTESDFRIVTRTLPDPAAGEITIEVAHLSVDPYMRGRMRDAPSYAPPVQLGDKMTGAGVGRVILSRSPRFQPGDWVQGVTGWCSHTVTDARGFRKLDPSVAPVSSALGVLGMTGLTAYFGLLDVGKPQPGETVLVSGAAGAVGSVAGQISRILGCRTAGIAGSDAKVAWLVDELGFDAAFNYKTATDYRDRIAAMCPNGVDVYFDNVGGEITDAVFPLLNVHARIPVCGQISQYNSEQPELGPRLFWLLITKRARMEGFLITDFSGRFREALDQLTQWYREGRLTHREEIRYGLENTSTAFLDMMAGRNIGKMIVTVKTD